MQVKSKEINPWWRFCWWMIGLAVIVIIWTILALTVFKQQHQLPDPITAFKKIFIELGRGYSWAAIGIGLGQAATAFIGSFVVAVGLIIGAKYWHPLTYIIQPFVTLGRTFPTLAVQIIFVAFCPLSLVSIIIPFLIVFPMTIQSLTSAIDNVNANNIEMVNVFRVSKFDQLRYVYLRAVTPYIFGALIAGFGLTFKVVLASQVLAGATPNYASIGYIMTKANGAKSYDIILAWGIIAVFISLIIELIMVEIKRLCMPWKYQDWQYLQKVLKRK